jgi:hypothetical protein
MIELITILSSCPPVQIPNTENYSKQFAILNEASGLVDMFLVKLQLFDLSFLATKTLYMNMNMNIFLPKNRHLLAPPGA